MVAGRRHTSSCPSVAALLSAFAPLFGPLGCSRLVSVSPEALLVKLGFKFVFGDYTGDFETKK